MEELAGRVRKLVLEILSKQDRLLIDITKLKESPVFKKGIFCGVHYCLRGPRGMLLTAIWDAQDHTIWCYDSTGRRFAHRGLITQCQG